ncbi:PREDICTED: probable pectinesterase/pectinesterase inhibitor 17 [Camelina sativa]|uniref:Probable pectinesterase/pectinesterase inhibitor 17 n=1 Tax=Camelina sativa TaxID=90675 RepID=A0ABM0YJE3_CAMSA|nr:PREDICTED: probable pectinesterase/pectinesterase inhibitor 17 [Camelina sativa]
MMQGTSLSLYLIFFAILSESVVSQKIFATVTVRKDGKGNFSRISDAIAVAPENNNGDIGYFHIAITEGVYAEYLIIPSNKGYVMMTGAGKNRTIITGNRSYRRWEKGFARGISHFETRRAQTMHKRLLYYPCQIDPSSTDAVLRASKTHSTFTPTSNFTATVTFTGPSISSLETAAVIFQNCNIYVRRTPTVLLAPIQSLLNPNQTSGVIIHNSRVTAATDLLPVLGSTKTYLGRPWDKYSTTVFMKTYLDILIDPRGWLECNHTTDVSTLFYAEFQNNGPGASTSG